MPMILMVGLPSSGKTTRAQQLKTFLESDSSIVVNLISENDILKSRNIDKNKFYFDSQKEKEIRGVLKSEALRVLGKDNVVILDAGNYIKGFRYELYCATKNYKTTQLTVECVVDKETSWSWSEQRPQELERYTRDAFDALHLRYEAPDSRNRWDSPLICLQNSEDLRKEDIKDALFSRKPAPPNQSTQSTPLSRPTICMS
uniref:Protein KTI12 homolog n=1 Tax=Lygus hesperus TaxID=30085 RepID=A0A0K8SWY6_LYGHE